MNTQTTLLRRLSGDTLGQEIIHATFLPYCQIRTRGSFVDFGEDQRLIYSRPTKADHYHELTYTESQTVDG